MIQRLTQESMYVKVRKRREREREVEKLVRMMRMVKNGALTLATSPFHLPLASFFTLHLRL